VKYVFSPCTPEAKSHRRYVSSSEIEWTPTNAAPVTITGEPPPFRRRNPLVALRSVR
jgi:hypothetical protein